MRIELVRPGGDRHAIPRDPLGFGYGRVSVILAILIAGFVAYLAIGRPDVGTLDTAAAIEP
jgi:hypothetical protein